MGLCLSFRWVFDVKKEFPIFENHVLHRNENYFNSTSTLTCQLKVEATVDI